MLYRNTQKKWLIALLPLLVLLLLFGSSFAQSQSGMIREYYACNYLEGKDVDDLMVARDYMVENIGDELESTTFLWTPVKTNNRFDFLWFDQHEDIKQWGKVTQSLWNTPRNLDVLLRFNNMSSCESGMVSHTPIFEGGSFAVTGSAAVVVSYACNLTPGADMAGVNQAVQHMNQVMSGLDVLSNLNVFMQVPIVSSSGRDLFYFGVYPDFEAYAAGTAALQGSSDYAEVTAHFARLQRCDTSLWEGSLIAQPQ